MDYRLREASEDDASWLEELRRRAYADLFVATWGGWDEERHRRHFEACLAGGDISIIEAGGEPVGMIQIFDEGDALEIAEVQIDPAHQGRGIGAAVLRDVLRREEARPVRLKVGLRNQGAIRLYERLGFEVLARTGTHCLMQRTPAAAA